MVDNDEDGAVTETVRVGERVSERERERESGKGGKENDGFVKVRSFCESCVSTILFV